MNRIWSLSLSLSIVALGACASDMASVESAESGGARNGGARAPGGEGAASDGAGTESAGNADDADPGPKQQAGILTAGVWDDNLNFDFYKKYLELGAPWAGVPAFSAAERDAAMQKWSAPRAGATELDVAFLIDTTGSMGDELGYLQAEIDGIAESIRTKFPATTARFGLVLYRDHGDEYLTRSFDFGSITEFRTNLAAQNVGGGGDYPEAVEEGLADTMKLSWRQGAVARLAFWVADAPHHVGDEQAVRTAIDAAVAKDVHIYPVAASGTDDRAEYTMRAAAQITGGRYLFLTDDSGVGDAHAEPHIPCYHVTRFDRAIVRMVESEMTGTHVQPTEGEILRSVGNPVGGKCQTKSSGDVTVY